MGTYEAYTAIAAGILSQLDSVQRDIHIMANRQTVRVVSPETWTVRTGKLDLSFHICTDRCLKGDDPDMVEVCEVTEEELHKAYNKYASLLSSVRFMMGVPGALAAMHDEGLETYEEAKRRADEHRMRSGVPVPGRSTS